MTNVIYNQTPSLVTMMDTDLNALADTHTNVGADILDNTNNRRYYAVAEIYLPAIDLSGETNPAVELYLIPSADGTNYADTGTDASAADYPPATCLVGVFAIQETNAAHRSVIEHIILDPLKYKPVVINKTGAAFSGTLNTLKIGTFTDSV